jgi:hypothetical protein
MDIGKALGFVFKDEQWIKKVLIGALLILVPLVGQFVVTGYLIAIIRNVKSGASRPMPDWSMDDMGKYLVDGLMLMVINLIYALPIIVLSCPFVLMGFLPLFMGDNPNLDTILEGAAGVLGIGLGCVGGLYGLLLALLIPVSQMRYAETRELAACLRFGEIFRFAFANIVNLIIILLVMSALGILIAPLALLTLGLLGLPANFWLGAVTSHLLGQIARRSGTT